MRNESSVARSSDRPRRSSSRKFYIGAVPIVTHINVTGTLRETHYDVVREEYESSQSRLSDYSDKHAATTVAVVRLPRDTKIDEYCDEWMPELGMPERHLKRFWAYRQGYRTNSAVADPTRRAYEDARLDYHYNRYLRTSDDAQRAIDELVSRLECGEDITLVCFEEPPEPCHRHKLKQVIETRLGSDYDFCEKQEVTV